MEEGLLSRIIHAADLRESKEERGKLYYLYRDLFLTQLSCKSARPQGEKFCRLNTVLLQKADCIFKQGIKMYLSI